MFKGKAIIIIGARQTGKTTLLRQLSSDYSDYLWFNGDESDTQSLFEKPSSSGFKSLFGTKKLIFIDEAQRIENIGIKLKLITDNLKDIQLVVSGSSAFELANSINEPLTGRKWEYQLFPISINEIVNYHGVIEEKRQLSHRLVFGSYPEVITNPGEEKNILKSIADSYLFKDILMWERIKKPEKLIKLLQALAFQVGNEVSYNEISKLIDLDVKTVEKYIQLLEQVFVIFRLNSLSRNLRSELKSSRKIYFYDNGIRNSIISAFNPPELRQDIGALWENLMVSERQKFLNYNQIWANRYFWRTKDQQEIDYVEEFEGKLYAFEFKYSSKKQPKLSKTFSKAYPDHKFNVISNDNYLEWLIKSNQT